MRCFFDTYAFFEIIDGNQKYKIYGESEAVTSAFNIAELNYGLKKKMSKEMADKYTDKYSKFIVEVTIDDIKKAMDLKTTKRNLSIPDAIGYTVAKRFDIKFLTGDKDFENMENVEFAR